MDQALLPEPVECFLNIKEDSCGAFTSIETASDIFDHH
ncbi:RNA-directed DNA polymerase from mobile element jockey, partial [Araneus ventricosus]